MVRALVFKFLFKFLLAAMGGAFVAGTAFPQAAPPQAALPQAASPENEDSRFSFFRAADGFLRLDGESGQVSLCTRHEAGWLCQALPEERAVLEAEIARLQAENVALKKEVLAHGMPLPDRVQSDTSTADHAASSASDGALTRVMSAIEGAWHRFAATVASVQRDLLQGL